MMQGGTDPVAGDRVKEVLNIDLEEKPVLQVTVQCDDMPAFAVMVEAERKLYLTIAKFDDSITTPVSILGRRKDDFAVALPRPFVVLKHTQVQSTALLTRSQTAATSFTTSKASPRISEARRVNLEVFLISRLLSLLATYDPVNTEPSTETIIPPCNVYDTQGHKVTSHVT